MKGYNKLGFMAKQMTTATMICILMIFMGIFVVWGLGYLTSVQKQFQEDIYKKQNELMTTAMEKLGGLIGDSLARNEALSNLRANAEILRRCERSLLVPEIFSNDDARELQLDIIEDTWAAIETDLQKYDALPHEGRDVELWQNFNKEFSTWKSNYAKVIDFIDQDDRDAAAKFSESQEARASAIASRKALNAVLENAALFIKESRQGTDQRIKGSQTATEEYIRQHVMQLAAQISFYTKFLIVAIAVFISAIFLLNYLLSRRISRNIGLLAKELASAAGQVFDATAQVTSSSNAVADGASSQAAAMEQIASSLTETSAKIKGNARDADEADALAKDSGKVVGEANQKILALNASMDEMTVASEETKKIVKTINEIAFQTNLLALNAAVEAARAGEAGAGFAVVAEEVRNLALRAAQAAQDTSGLIEQTISKVRQGNAIVQSTSGNFMTITEFIQKITGLISNIAAASRDQAYAITEINEAITNIDSITQGNAASAEETAAAANEMSSMTESMNDIAISLTEFVHGEQSRREGESPIPLLSS